MRKLVVQLNDGSFINIPADRMQYVDNCIIATNAGELVAILDISVVLYVYLSDKGTTK